MSHNLRLLNLQRSPGPDVFFQTQSREALEAVPGDSGATPELTEDLLRIHDYERKRIGQELHDAAGQLLVSLQLSIARLRNVHHNCEDDSLIEEIQDTAKLIDQEIRALSFLHFPAELGNRRVSDALRTLVHGFARRTGILVSYRHIGDDVDISQSLSKSLFRVAQEALVNIHRHAHATSAKVVLQSRAKEILLTITDNGIGLKSDVEPGIGLESMRHRVTMLGGDFQVSSLRHGTRVAAALPLT